MTPPCHHRDVPITLPAAADEMTMRRERAAEMNKRFSFKRFGSQPFGDRMHRISGRISHFSRRSRASTAAASHQSRESHQEDGQPRGQPDDEQAASRRASHAGRRRSEASAVVDERAEGRPSRASEGSCPSDHSRPSEGRPSAS